MDVRPSVAATRFPAIWPVACRPSAGPRHNYGPCCTTPRSPAVRAAHQLDRQLDRRPVAARWPDEVAGLVLVDPTNLSRWSALKPEPAIVDGDDESGCVRLDWEHSYAELGQSVPPAGSRRVVVSSSDGRWERDASPARWHEPLTLAEVDQLWQAAQREWVARLSAQHVVADTAGHFVHHDQPDLVAHVVLAVLQAARSGEPAPAGHSRYRRRRQ